MNHDLYGDNDDVNHAILDDNADDEGEHDMTKTDLFGPGWNTKFLVWSARVW